MSQPLPKLLITGVSGFLGSYVPELAHQQWELHGFYNHSPVSRSRPGEPLIKTSRVDLLDHQRLRAAFEELCPDAVLHLAAQSNPNYCEQHPEISHRINVEATQVLAELGAAGSVPMIFVSSDLVFDGANAPYAETDEPAPISIYGQQKVEAEKLLLRIHPKACVARCPVMYGIPSWGSSFMSSWLEKLKQGQPIYAFTDEYRSKVDGRTAVEGLLLLLRKKVNGIYHLGGKERISRYDFAIKMARVFGLPEGLVIPSVRADVQMPAARPADVSLLSTKAWDLGFSPRSIQESLEKIRDRSF